MECWSGPLTQSIEKMIGGGVGVVLICKTVKPCVYKKGQDLYTHGFTNNMVLQISNPPSNHHFYCKSVGGELTLTINSLSLWSEGGGHLHLLIQWDALTILV